MPAAGQTSKSRTGWVNVLLLGITLAYPFAIYFGLTRLPVGAFAGILAGLFIVRALLARDLPSRRWIIPIALLGVGFCLVVVFADSAALLLYYPVLINLVMLAVFAGSLLWPPSVIERLARITDPDLPPAGVQYTRKVTWVWCFFFASTAAFRPIRHSPVTCSCGQPTTAWSPT